MKKIDFDIKYRPQIESGEYKVETKDGHPVRIICWDAMTDWCVCGMIKDYNPKSTYGYPELFDEKGICVKGKNKDLVIVTNEPEFTEFESTLADMVDDAIDCAHKNSTDIIAIVEKWKDELLSLAKKQAFDNFELNDKEKDLQEVLEDFAEDWAYDRSDSKTEILTACIARIKYRFKTEIDNAYKTADEVQYKRGYEKGRQDAIVEIFRGSDFTINTQS